MSTELPIEGDPGLTGAERETILQWSQQDEYVSVFSEEPSIMRGLTENSQFELERTREHDDVVVAIWGRLPAGSVTIKNTARGDNHHSDMVVRRD